LHRSARAPIETICRKRAGITTAPEAMCRLFGFVNPAPDLPPRYNAAPTDKLPVVRLDRDGKPRVGRAVLGADPILGEGREDRLQEHQRARRDGGDGACLP